MWWRYCRRLCCDLSLNTHKREREERRHMKTTMAIHHKTDRCGTARLDTRRVNTLRIQLLHSAFVGSLTQGGVYLCLFLLLFGDFRCQCVCSLLGCRRFLSLVTFTSSSRCFFFLTYTHKTNVYINHIQSHKQKINK